MEPAVDLGESPVTAPTLLIELPSWHSVFRRNLSDLFRPPHQPPLRLASKPADFWPDIFVPSRLPWGRFLESSLFHILFAAMLWGASLLWARRPQIVMQPVFSHQDVIYYQASELLPPLDTGSVRPRQSVRGEPAYAPQPIISVPREADNHRQTVVTPPNLKLDHDVPLPNVVSWPKTALAVPIAATARTVLSKVRSLDASVVEPPPDVRLASSRQAMRSLQPAVVQPTPQVDASTTRRVGDMNIAPAQVVAPAPQLPVQAQHVSSGPAGLGNNTVVPPAPSVSGTGVANSGGRLIALGLNPSVAAPITAPSGNRRGSFAANPQGKPGAAGTPNIAGSEKGSQGATGNRGHGDIPLGLYVGADPNAKSSPIGGNGQGDGSGGTSFRQSAQPVVMAKTTPPRVSATPQRQAEQVASDSPGEEEKKVFGDRKFYSMTLNIPNLNSSGGSWVIHFAERDESGESDKQNKGELVAPAATAMFDPAYPLELMKQHVQGTVTLYAVIGSDGSVSGVRVLNGIDDRLDEYARQALMRWHFRPASKNGNPVALEAVVRVPFRVSRTRSSF